jgi:1-acyl-sn-glycerol-3-phosphate acyltransferase
MGGTQNIDKWSLRYWMIKHLWVKWVHSLYYKRIEIQNLSKIPGDERIIFASNHQNALMDAMALVLRLPFQTVFMARADIFKTPWLVKILTVFKILPVYRIRDGISSLNKNEEMFDTAAQIIENRRNPLCLFPEGNHGEKRRLRPLVKGIFRIAFKAQSGFENKPAVKIVPIGIDYEHYQKFRKTLFINVGESIDVSDYWELFTTEPVAATNKLRDKLSEELRKVMLDIQTDEYYDLYMGLKEFYRPYLYKKMGVQKDTLANRFKADKELINKLDNCLLEKPETIKSINENYSQYASLRQKLNLRDWVFQKANYSMVLSVLSLILVLALSPLLLLGLFNNWPHYYYPPVKFRNIKDKQFQSTAMWGMGIVIQAVYYFILSLLAIFILPWWWLILIYIATLPLTGLIAYAIRNFYIKTMARIRYSLNRKSPDVVELSSKREELISQLDSII